MKTTSAEKALLALAISVCIVIVGLVVFWKPLNEPVKSPQNVGGSGFTIESEKYTLTAPSSGVGVQAGQILATTSVHFLPLDGTASSTVTGWTGRATSVDMDLSVTASTTGTKYLWQNFFSPNGIDWYCEDGSSVDSTTVVTHGAGCLTHYWTPGVTATTSRNITISAVQSRWFKTVFSTTVAAGAIHVLAIPNEPTPN